MLAACDNTMLTIRVVIFLGCAVSLVVTPLNNILQSWFCIRTADCTSNVKVAADVPDPDAVTLKVVVPQPVANGVTKGGKKVNFGRASVILSVIWRLAVNLKLYNTVVCAEMIGLENSSLLTRSDGKFIAVDIVMAVAGTSVTAANDADSVRKL
jgi:hypothetical protein